MILKDCTDEKLEHCDDRKLEDCVNEEYRKLWVRYWKNSNGLRRLLEKWPFQYPRGTFKTNCILFVGMNPSYNKKNIDEAAKKLNLAYDHRIFELRHNLRLKVLKNVLKNPNTIKMIERIEGEFFQCLSYYKKLKKLKEDVVKDNIPFVYVDLFPIRSTNQDEVKKGLMLEKASNTNNKKEICFVKESIRVFKDIITRLKPRYIVVVNGSISSMIMDGMEANYPSMKDNGPPRKAKENNLMYAFKSNKITFKPNNFDETGYRLMSVENHEYPLVLSGMITGQRPLDKASRELLIWSLRRIVDPADKIDISPER
ncbi:MAG: hypothetical protein QXV17_07125 [Candidatus Micrarchaeaceae archaeon]